MAKRIPGKEEFHETIRYFRHRLSKLERAGKVEMKLGMEIQFSDMELFWTTVKRVSIDGL